MHSIKAPDPTQQISDRLTTGRFATAPSHPLRKPPPRAVPVAAVVKSLLVRRGEDDHLLVLVPGDRSISWPKLRAVLGVSRLSMPDAKTALAVTGYERGTITPLGLDLPVVVDERMRGEAITLGSGVHGVAIGLDADAIIASYSAIVADVSDS